jgi:hypothetical protein
MTPGRPQHKLGLALGRVRTAADEQAGPELQLPWGFVWASLLRQERQRNTNV